MKLLWVYAVYENLGVELLAAVLRAHGHEVDLVLDPRLFDDHFSAARLPARVFSFRNRVVDEAARRRPDAVLFSVVSDDFPWFRDTAARIRERLPDTPTIAGGIHITSVPRAALENSAADYGIIGEGERALPALLERIRDRAPVDDLPNLVFRKNGEITANPPGPFIDDLDTLPFPDKTIYKNTSYSPMDAYSLTCSRGCPFRCSFCNNDLIAGIYGRGYLRLRGVDGVMAEIEFARRTYTPRLFNFLDETFGFNKKWLDGFSEKYARGAGAPCIVCANPLIVDREYAAALKRMNCRKADLGVQTLNPELKRRVLNRRETPEQVRNAIELLRGAGIQVAAENMINLPGETEAHLAETARFYNTVRPDTIKFFWLRYYPGTSIVEAGRAAGVLTNEDTARIERGESLGSIATGGPAQTRLARRFYAFFIIMQMLPPRAVEWLIARRLYRAFRLGPLAGVSYALLRLLNRKAGPEAEIMLTRHKKHVLFYLKKWFAGKIGIPGT